MFIKSCTLKKQLYNSEIWWRAAAGYGINEVGKGKVPFAELVSEDPDYGRFREEVGNEEAERIQ